MKMFDVQLALEAIAEARATWDKANRKFLADVEYVMTRLINEAAVNFMSAEQVARASGLTTKRVRMLMRNQGLDPKAGKRLLSDKAASTLAQNAALLGVEPHEFDLMSPLAYLPMGSDLRKFLETNQGVTDLDEVTLVHSVNYRDHEISCGHLAYNDPVLVTSDLDKITCEPCRKASVRGA